MCTFFFFFSSRRRHTRCLSDWSSDVCSSDLYADRQPGRHYAAGAACIEGSRPGGVRRHPPDAEAARSEEHTSELQSLRHLVCRLLLEKKKKHNDHNNYIINSMKNIQSINISL